MPTAVPTMPPSARGVSMTRSAPNSSCRPCVARNTPPNLPTSSPSTTTSGSRRISSRSASLTAWITFIVGTGIPPRSRVGVAGVRHARIRGDRLLQLPELLPLLPERLGVHVLEQALQRRLGRERLRLLQRALDLLANARPQLLLRLVVVQPARGEVPAQAQDGVLLPPRLD